MNQHRDMADTITRLMWDNFLRSEPALIMRDLIAIELEKTETRTRERVFRGIAENLAANYRKDPTGIAALCDETLDKSGALLGYVREAAMP